MRSVYGGLWIGGKSIGKFWVLLEILDGVMFGSKLFVCAVVEF